METTTKSDCNEIGAVKSMTSIAQFTIMDNNEDMRKTPRQSTIAHGVLFAVYYLRRNSFYDMNAVSFPIGGMVG